MARSRAVETCKGWNRPFGIDIIGAGHAKALGREIHLLREALDVAAAGFRQHIGHVIGRIDQHALQGEVDRDRAADLHAELARRLLRRQFRNRNLLIELELAGFQLFEDDIGRHQFGERGRIPGLAGAIGGQYIARRRIEYEARPGHRPAG